MSLPSPNSLGVFVAVAAAAAVIAPSAWSAVIEVRTVPALPGVTFELDGLAFTTNRRGIARIDVADESPHRLEAAKHARPEPGVRATFARWGDNVFTPGRSVSAPSVLEVGFEVSYRVREHFVDLAGRPVPSDRVASLTITNSLGEQITIPGGKPRWLKGARVARRSTGLEETEIRYAVERAVVNGANVVHRQQQRFYPKKTRDMRVALLLYSAHFSANDVLLGRPAGSGIVLTYPDGHSRFYRFASDGSLTLGSLPRGHYQVRAKASGLSFLIPIALSRDQDVPLKVVTYVDMAIVSGLLGSLAIGLLLLRRPRLRAAIRHPLRRDAAVRAELSGSGRQ